jgi:uncharacterized protein involved in response to NO
MFLEPSLSWSLGNWWRRQFAVKALNYIPILSCLKVRFLFVINIMLQEKARKIFVLLLTIEHSNCQLQSVAQYTSCCSGFLLFLKRITVLQTNKFLPSAYLMFLFIRLLYISPGFLCIALLLHWCLVVCLQESSLLTAVKIISFHGLINHDY